jgi:hypothetical protein
LSASGNAAARIRYEHTAVLWAENQPHLIDRVHRFIAPRSGFCGRLTFPSEGSARLRHRNLGTEATPEPPAQGFVLEWRHWSYHRALLQLQSTGTVLPSAGRSA